MYMLGLFITFVLWIIVIAILPQKDKSNDAVADSEEDTPSEDIATETFASENEPVQCKSNMLFLSWKKENFDLMQLEMSIIKCSC